MTTVWRGAKYHRKGTRDFRDSNNGNVFDKNGKFLGVQPKTSQFERTSLRKLRGEKPQFKPRGA